MPRSRSTVSVHFFVFLFNHLAGPKLGAQSVEVCRVDFFSSLSRVRVGKNRGELSRVEWSFLSQEVFLIQH